MCVSGGLAALHELQTVYGLRDLFNLIEIIAVDSHNRGVAASAAPGRG